MTMAIWVAACAVTGGASAAAVLGVQWLYGQARARFAARSPRTARGRRKRRAARLAATHDLCGLADAERLEFRLIISRPPRDVKTTREEKQQR
jgi:hypothetical protein